MKSNAWRCITPLVTAWMLAACGSVPRQLEPPSEPPKPVTKTPAKKSAVVQKRGGGYYKDDGPGEEIPDNLDDLPDAEPKLEPLHRFANRPYVVFGKTYTPQTAIVPFKQRGIGSWYGKKFHGQRTSIGEPYDMFAMTAAHPTLAIPSYVRVTSVNTGRSVLLRVIDRGPFHADRIIDLSYAAAYKLGYIENGSTQVVVESILPEEYGSPALAQARPAPAARPANAGAPDEIAALAGRPAPAQPPAVAPPIPGSVEPAVLPQGVYLQLGAFSSRDNAESLRAHVVRELDWLTEGVHVTAGGGINRVQLGPYANRSDAERTAEKIQKAVGYKPTVVTR